MQKNFNNQKANLADKDIDDILKIIGYRCRVKTVNRLRSILTYSRSIIPEHGILSRLILDEHGWHYCAGQDYASEIKTVRDCILKG